jgi:23S rRNA (cytosine1962-C5)-methyltransferase
MDSAIKIILKPGKEQSVMRLHPWIFSGAIKKIEGLPREGDIAEVFSHDNQYLATGHYQIGSIAIRLFSFQQVTADTVFWRNKIQAAWDLRRELGLTGNADTSVYRLVNGEGDGMPGLIIDYYNGIAVIQTHSVGMYYLRDQITSVLHEIYNHSLVAVYDKSENTLPVKAGLR